MRFGTNIAPPPRRRRRTIAVLTFALCAYVLGAGGATSGAKREAEFGAVVDLIESHYGAKRVGISTAARVGVVAAKTTAKVVSRRARRYLRYGDFKLAVFEDQDFSSNHFAFRRRVRAALEPDWLPLVIVCTSDEAQTFTYTKQEKDKFKVLVVVVEQRDAVVAQVDLNAQEFLKLLRNPAEESRVIADEAADENDD